MNSNIVIRYVVTIAIYLPLFELYTKPTQKLKFFILGIPNVKSQQ